jgi:hypothetical protein
MSTTPPVDALGVPLVIEMLANEGVGATSPLTPAVPVVSAKTAAGKAMTSINTRTRHIAKILFIFSPFKFCRKSSGFAGYIFIGYFLFCG